MRRVLPSLLILSLAACHGFGKKHPLPPPVRPSLVPPPADLAHLADGEHEVLPRRRAELVTGALAALTARFPVISSYSAVQAEATVDDLGHILDFLAAAVYVDDDTLFTEFLDWLVDLLRVRRVPVATVTDTVGHYAAELADLPRARRCLAAAHRLLTAAGVHYAAVMDIAIS